MALIAIAADKGAPGVTTAAIALGAVWPRPVLLAECDPAGSDLVYRFPAAGGGRLDPRRGLLSLAVASRRGLQPHHVWEHAQKLYGGLDILAGVSGAEQGAGLDLLWSAVGRILASVPQADVIADCGRLGTDGPLYDLLAQAATVVLLTRATLGEVIRLRDRVAALAAAGHKRGRPSVRVDVAVVAEHRNITSAIEEVSQALRQAGAPARVIGGLAYEPRSAEQLRGDWGGKLDKSMFIRTVRSVASYLVTSLPEPSAAAGPAAPGQPPPGPHPPGPPAAPPLRPRSPAVPPAPGPDASGGYAPPMTPGQQPGYAAPPGPVTAQPYAAAPVWPTAPRPDGTGPQPRQPGYPPGPEGSWAGGQQAAARPAQPAPASPPGREGDG